MDVRQVSNVLGLLEYFARRGRPATLAEIAEDLSWPRSSTFNIIGTLAKKGYLYEPSQRGSYYPSPRWSAVIQAISDSDPLPRVMRDLVDEVAAETGETTAIGSISGLEVVFLYVCESKHPVRYFAEIGTKVPIHASSVGRALLSQLAPRERHSLYRKIVFEKHTETTPLSIETIEIELAAARARGYHQSDSEFIPDLAGVASELSAQDKKLSLVVAGPTMRCLERRPDTARIIKAALERRGLSGSAAQAPTMDELV